MKRNKAVILAGLATWAMLGVAHAVTNNAVTNGLLNAVDTWGVGSMPVAPDGNVWNANGDQLGDRNHEQCFLPDRILVLRSIFRSGYGAGRKCEQRCSRAAPRY